MHLRYQSKRIIENKKNKNNIKVIWIRRYITSQSIKNALYWSYYIIPSNLFNERITAQKNIKNIISLFNEMVPSPAGGRCLQGRRFRSGRCRRCSGPPQALDLSLDSLTLAPWTGSWGKRQETRAPRSQARWCSENEESPWFPESVNKYTHTNRAHHYTWV